MRMSGTSFSARGSAAALAALCGLAWLAFGAGVSAQPLMTRYVAGEHYQAIDQPVESKGDAIPVIEFFLYSCPHCYHLEPDVAAWRESLADDVVFRRVPVLFGADGRLYARMYYTAQALGVLERLHPKIFNAIHERGLALTTPDAIRAFFVTHGVDGERFDTVFDSAAIDKKVAYAGELMRRFKVRAVPSLGVAGRYWVTGRMAGSNAAMFKVADYLIERARTRGADEADAGQDAEVVAE